LIECPFSLKTSLLDVSEKGGKERGKGKRRSENRSASSLSSDYIDMKGKQSSSVSSFGSP
jgi:hypothetical protein